MLNFEQKILATKLTVQAISKLTFDGLGIINEAWKHVSFAAFPRQI